MSFGLYIAGFVVVFAGLIYGATILHVSTHASTRDRSIDRNGSRICGNQ
jgi:hypothetical protein